MHISGKEGFSLPDFLSACASGGGKCNGEANCKTIQGFLLENGHLNAQGERIEIWDLPSSSLAFRIVYERLAFKNGFPIHARLQLAYIAIGSRNMLLVTLAKTRCKFSTRKLSPKVKAQNRNKKLHSDKEKTLVELSLCQFPPFFRGPLVEPFYLI